MIIFCLSALLFSSFKLSLYTTLLGLQGAQSRLKRMHVLVGLAIYSSMWPSNFWHRSFVER